VADEPAAVLTVDADDGVLRHVVPNRRRHGSAIVSRHREHLAIEGAVTARPADLPVYVVG